jgi:pimeloyl-ACP methyl ester carboxylesterase
MRPVAEDVEGRSIEGSGHFLQEEQPARVADEITAFLD